MECSICKMKFPKLNFVSAYSKSSRLCYVPIIINGASTAYTVYKTYKDETLPIERNIVDCTKHKLIIPIDHAVTDCDSLKVRVGNVSRIEYDTRLFVAEILGNKYKYIMNYRSSVVANPRTNRNLEADLVILNCRREVVCIIEVNGDQHLDATQSIKDAYKYLVWSSYDLHVLIIPQVMYSDGSYKTFISNSLSDVTECKA